MRRLHIAKWMTVLVVGQCAWATVDALGYFPSTGELIASFAVLGLILVIIESFDALIDRRRE